VSSRRWWHRLCCILALAAPAAHAESDDASALREWLEETPIVVRGEEGTASAGTTPETSGFRYTTFTVTEVLKGPLGARTVLIREPVDAPRARAGGEVIVLLGEGPDEAGSYPIAEGASSGRYRVLEGGQVQVNAAGVDADSVPPKDKHRQSPNSGMALDEFRRIARETTPVTLTQPAAPAVAAEVPRPDAAVQPGAPRARTATPETTPEPEPPGRPWWPAGLALVIVVAVAAAAYRRRR
jgi:hypothetical protein